MGFIWARPYPNPNRGKPKTKWLYPDTKVVTNSRGPLVIHLFLAIVLSDGLTAAAAAALPDPISSGATTASSLPHSLIPADGAAATASSPLSRFYPSWSLLHWCFGKHLRSVDSCSRCPLQSGYMEWVCSNLRHWRSTSSAPFRYVDSITLSYVSSS